MSYLWFCYLWNVHLWFYYQWNVHLWNVFLWNVPTPKFDFKRQDFFSLSFWYSLTKHSYIFLFLLDLKTSAFLFKQSFDYPLPSPSTYQFQNICIAGSRRDWQLELYLCSFSFFSWTSDNIRTGFIMAKFKLWKKVFSFSSEYEFKNVLAKTILTRKPFNNW